MKDESFHFVTGLNIFNQHFIIMWKKSGRGASSSRMEIQFGVMTNNDRERKWRCETKFENVSSMRQ